MKNTLMNSALALTIMLGAGAAFASDNGASAGDDQIAVQDALNGSLNGNLSGNTAGSNNDDDFVDADLTNVANGNFNGNLSGNTADSNNDNDQADVDLTDVANGSLSGNLSGNTAQSNNDNDLVDADIVATDLLNDKSADDNDFIDADIVAQDMLNDKSTNSFSSSFTSTDDHSISIEDVALLVNHQALVGVAAQTQLSTQSGDVTTGSIMYGAETNKMAAGNMTTSVNTGAGSVALSASTIQANGTFTIGN